MGNPRNTSTPGQSDVTGPGNTTSSATASPAPAGTASASSRRYYAFLVMMLVLLSALGSFVNDMYTPALPSMCRFFGCSIPLSQLGITMGMVGLALGQFILGPLSDRYGRKPILIGSVTLFIVAAVVSLFSPTIHFFNACRLLQGMGAAGGYFLARTIPADVYGGRELAKLMSLVGAINGVAPASAPVIGGITADAFGWRGIFVLLAVYAIILLGISHFLKESLPASRRTTGKWWKTMSGYLELLRNRPFMIHVCFKGTALGLLFAYISAAPFIIQDHYGLSQTMYGLLIGFNALFVAGGSMTAVHFRPLKRAAAAGAVLLGAGATGMVLSLWLIHSLPVFEIFMCVMLYALGLIFTTSNTLSMNEGRARAGEASAILGISGYVTGAVAAPLVGMGNVLHSTAIVFLALTILVQICAVASSRLAPDLEK